MTRKLPCAESTEPNGCRHYYVVRMFQDSERAPRRRKVKTGLTLADAQAWCTDPETSWKTCTKSAGRARTRVYGPWFDGYDHK